MADVTQALKRELARLESELKADPRYRKIAAIKDLLAQYEVPSAAGSTATAEHALAGSTISVISNGIKRTRSDSKATVIRGEVHSQLEQRGVMHREQILMHLTAKGLMGHEKKPLAQLAAYLSDWKEFESVGGGKWRIRETDRVIEAKSESESESVPESRKGPAAQARAVLLNSSSLVQPSVTLNLHSGKNAE